jgi:hypothetical protein
VRQAVTVLCRQLIAGVLVSDLIRNAHRMPGQAPHRRMTSTAVRDARGGHVASAGEPELVARCIAAFFVAVGR